MSDYPPGMTLRPIDVWPGPLTARREVSQFSAPYRSTLKLLDRELRLLDPKDSQYPPTVLQIAMRERDFRIDGMPRANAVHEHPGVILSVEPRNKPRMSIPCDTFTKWQDNLRGIAMSMNMLRTMERYGCVRNDQQYQGWQAIEARPAAPQFTADTAEAFLRTLYRDEGDGLDLDTVPQVFRRVRGLAHPDRNDGDRTMWDRVEVAAGALRAAGRLP